MSAPDFFRREALDHHTRGAVDSPVILIPPTWTRWMMQVLLAGAAGAIAFLILGTSSQYADGPAIIRARDRVALTAHLPSTVEAVHVGPGARVRKGDRLVTFHAAEEAAQSATLRQQLDAALVRMLANPADEAARHALADLRSQGDLLAVRLENREIRAPEDGTIGDVRVRPGQGVAPGDVLLSMTRGGSGHVVVALLPGQRRPAMHPGQSLRLEVAGYAYAYLTVTIERVGEDVVSPLEVRRLLGTDVADGLVLPGPVVLVHAALPGDHFDVGGYRYPYHDGMRASARARLQSERLITTLIPGLRALQPAP